LCRVVKYTAKKTNDWILNKAGVKKETRELPGERDNAGNNARCTLERKTMHALDRQYQYVDRTSSGRFSQNDGGQR